MSGRVPPWRAPLLAAGACFLLTCVVYLASRRAGVNWIDEKLVGWISWRAGYQSITSHENVGDLRSMFDVLPYSIWVVLLLCTLVWRRQVELAGLMAAMLLGANLTTWALQHRLSSPIVVQILDEPSWGTYWPSGHTTAAVALGAATVLVSTPAWRPFVAAAAFVLTACAALSNLLLKVHVPTDILGGVGIAGTWAFLALAAQTRWPRLRPR